MSKKLGKLSAVLLSRQRQLFSIDQKVVPGCEVESRSENASQNNAVDGSLEL
ncbi:hypothetical protein [Paracoccus homiensis]|uniref:hypothetical protein n=1 Tax=Paracoccus homiensis TaxID=364199 RepID=UPI0015872D6A|nr:hypothetical protein [Paracoccus homiensis]